MESNGGPPATLPSAERAAVPAAPGAALAAAADLKAEWLRGLKETTRKGYARDLDDFGRFAAARYPTSPAAALDWLLALPTADAHLVALAYRDDLVAPKPGYPNGLASATVARRLATLKSVAALANTIGRCAWVLRVKAPPPEPRHDRSGPDEAGLKKLARAARKAGQGAGAVRDRAILALLAGQGLRRAEVCGLDLADVDFGRRVARVLGKGKREKVDVELADDVVTALAEWCAVRGAHPGALFHGTDPKRKEWGVPLSGETVRRVVARIAKAAGLKGVRPHGLRHAFATLLDARGETLLDVMHELRQTKPETTARYIDKHNKRPGRLARKRPGIFG